MQVSLTRLKFNNTYAYKYRPIEYCCEKIKRNENIVFTNEDLAEEFLGEDDYDSTAGNIPLPKFCTSVTKTVGSWGDEWEETTNYPINFCPHCGEPINIEISAEADVSVEYDMLEKQRKDLWEKCQKTDSKKKDSELREQVEELDRRINEFYTLSEFD